MAKNLQHFEVFRQHLKKAKAAFALSRLEEAVPFVLLPLLLDIREDEVEATVTDNSFQQSRGKRAGHDRGTDAIMIEADSSQSTVHIFNFKYTHKFENTERFFSSAEIDKILVFLRALLDKDPALLGDMNQALTDKVREIWAELEARPTKFLIYFASNLTQGFEPSEKRRLDTSLAEFSIPPAQIETQSTIAARFADRNRVKIDGQFKGIHKDLFELSTGNVRALVLRAEATQILRLLCNDPSLRNNAAHADLAALAAARLDESAFDDNVRIYLKQKPTINQNIKATALSPENTKFFYFNNGITMTCDRYAYPSETSGPIIQLENVQVANGGQTLHALFDALKADQSKIGPIGVLCRIYETKDRELSSRIAERTNSQIPVDTRDIHSLDIEQINLEQEFSALGLFYERKKAQFADKPQDKRVDSEKCGQVYLGFYEEMPLEAKNRKRIIFGDKRETIFNSNTTAEKLLLPLRLFDKIEELRAATASGQRSWLNYASYYILFALKKVAEKKNLDLTYANLAKISALYGKAVALVRKARNVEKKALGDDFADVLFFKQKKAQVAIAALV